MSHYGRWAPYVPVDKRRRQAARRLKSLLGKGVAPQPVAIAGRKIALSFWGKAWCDHMETHVDYDNRLPRGRTYVRNGSVCHLAMQGGKIDALVSGSRVYRVAIEIDRVPAPRWDQIQRHCGGQVSSLVELLQGRISDNVMSVVTDPESGLFPRRKEIHFHCSCPDYAAMCKHTAAVLYGVGARLDEQPELLFALRGVDHLDLLAMSADAALSQTGKRTSRPQVQSGDLASVFGIDLELEEPPLPPAEGTPNRPATRQAAARKTAARKTATRKTATRKTATRKTAARETATTAAAAKESDATRKSAAQKSDAMKKSAVKKSDASSKPATRKATPTPKSATRKAAAKRSAAPQPATPGAASSTKSGGVANDFKAARKNRVKRAVARKK